MRTANTNSLEKYWPLIFRLSYLALIGVSVAVLAYVIAFERYAFLPIIIASLLATLSFSVMNFDQNVWFDVNPKAPISLQYLVLSIFILYTYNNSFSFVSYGLLALAAAIGATIVLNTEIADSLRSLAAINIAVAIVVVMQNLYAAGIAGGDTRALEVDLINKLLRGGIQTFTNNELFALHNSLIAMFCRLTGFSPFWGYVTVVSTITILGMFISFGLIRRLLDGRIAGIAMLVIPLADFSHKTLARPGVLSFSYSLFFGFLLYIFVKPNRMSDIKYIFATGVFLLSLAIVHPFSSAVASFVLVLIAGLRYNKQNLIIALAFAVAFWGYIVTVGFPNWTSFVGSSIVDLYSTFFGGESSSFASGGRYSEIPLINLVFNTIGQGILLGVAILGGLTLMSRFESAYKHRVILGTTFVIVAIAVFGTVFDLTFLLPQRWYLFTYFFGVNALFAVVVAKSSKKSIAVILVVMLALFGPMSAIAGFSTAPFYDRPYAKTYGTAQEVAVTDWTNEYAPDAIGPHGYQASADNNIYRRSGVIDPAMIEDNQTVFYDEIYEKTGLIAGGGSGMKIGAVNYIYPSNELLITESKIYSSGNNYGYRT